MIWRNKYIGPSLAVVGIDQMLKDVGRRHKARKLGSESGGGLRDE